MVLQIRNKSENGAYTTYDFVPLLLADTGSGTPAEPNSAITLALVSISSGQASVLNANITDSRPVVSSGGIQAYTPTVTGGGSATFTTRTGWWVQLGKLVLVDLYVVVSAAGSGSSVVQLSLPVPARTTEDQLLPAHGQSLKGTSSSVNGFATINTSGGASQLTKITLSSNTGTNSDTNLLGSDLGTGANLSVMGWYRAA